MYILRKLNLTFRTPPGELAQQKRLPIPASRIPGPGGHCRGVLEIERHLPARKPRAVSINGRCAGGRLRPPLPLPNKLASELVWADEEEIVAQVKFTERALSAPASKSSGHFHPFAPPSMSVIYCASGPGRHTFTSRARPGNQIDPQTRSAGPIAIAGRPTRPYSRVIPVPYPAPAKPRTGCG
jgi:hypothetical protein